jgi:hypothetical protein
MDVQHSQFVGAAVIPVRRMRCHLLMAEGDVVDTDLVTCVDQSIVGMSALSEDLGDPFLL